MTIKKNLENEKDDRWRRKGGVIKQKYLRPIVCPDCGGLGYTQDISELCISDPHPCSTCDSTGEIWK